MCQQKNWSHQSSKDPEEGRFRRSRKNEVTFIFKHRFFYEIEILKNLDHPNIVRLHEVFEDDKRYYLVTELCTGGELFEEITKRSHFSERDAAGIIK